MRTAPEHHYEVSLDILLGVDDAADDEEGETDDSSEEIASRSEVLRLGVRFLAKHRPDGETVALLRSLADRQRESEQVIEEIAIRLAELGHPDLHREQRDRWAWIRTDELARAADRALMDAAEKAVGPPRSTPPARRIPRDLALLLAALRRVERRAGDYYAFGRREDEEAVAAVISGLVDVHGLNRHHVAADVAWAKARLGADADSLLPSILPFAEPPEVAQPIHIDAASLPLAVLGRALTHASHSVVLAAALLLGLTSLRGRAAEVREVVERTLQSAAYRLRPEDVADLRNLTDLIMLERQPAP